MIWELGRVVFGVGTWLQKGGAVIVLLKDPLDFEGSIFFFLLRKKKKKKEVTKGFVVDLTLGFVVGL